MVMEMQIGASPGEGRRGGKDHPMFSSIFAWGGSAPRIFLIFISKPLKVPSRGLKVCLWGWAGGRRWRGSLQGAV